MHMNYKKKMMYKDGMMYENDMCPKREYLHDIPNVMKKRGKGMIYETYL